jgi:hypothetical protein
MQEDFKMQIIHFSLTVVAGNAIVAATALELSPD